MATRDEKIAFIQEQMQKSSQDSSGPTRDEKIAFIESQQAKGTPEKSFGEKAIDTVVEVGRRIDSVTGAPTRKAISAMQDGENPISAFAGQFAENPDLAPTGKQIAVKAGVPDKVHMIRSADDQQKFDELHNPGWSASMKQTGKKWEPVEVNPAEGVGFLVDMGADWTNALPLIGGAKKLVASTDLGAKALKVTGGAASKVGNFVSEGAKTAGKKVLSAALGPSTDSINHYLARAENVRNAKSVEEIKNSIDSTMNSLFDGVEKAKLSKEEAKEALSIVESKIRDTVRDSNFQFRVDQADVKESLRSAKQRLDEAYSAKVKELTDVKSPIHLSDDVSTSIQDLKSKVKKGSEESYKILDEDPQAYGVRNGGKVLREMADDMDILPFEATPKTAASGSMVNSKQWGTVKPSSSGPVTSQSRGVQSELRRFADLLEQTPERVPARELKKMLQQLDASEKAMYGQPGFDSRVSQAYKNIRATIDEAIKTNNPAYASKMSEVAGDMNLMQKALDRFGDSRAATSRLNSIGSRTAEADRALLKQIGEATGRDLSGPVDQYLDAQGKLKDPRILEELKASLPEMKDVRTQEEVLAARSRPEAPKEFVRENLEREGLPEHHSTARGKLEAADEGLESSKTKLAPFKNVTPTNSEGMIKGLMKAPGKENIEIRRTIENLSKSSEKDFVNWIADRRAADEFAGEFRIGSRNVNLWTVLGAVTGGLPGAGAGAAIGAMTDKFGPRLAQKILDGIIAIKGTPTPGKIMALKLEPRAEAYLIRELSKSNSAGQEFRKVSEEKSDPKKGHQKWMSDGGKKLMEHDSASIDEKEIEKLKKTKKGQDLLIHASGLTPGSKAMEKVMEKIRSASGGE